MLKKTFHYLAQEKKAYKGNLGQLKDFAKAQELQSNSPSE